MIEIEEKDDRFYVSQSTQPGAGRGLFASKRIKKGDDLEVIGVLVDRGSVADLCSSYADEYKFAADYADSFKKHIIPMGYGGIVNHANNKRDQNVEIRYVKREGEEICVYHFIRDVEKNEEVLGDYGEEFRRARGASEDKEWGSFLELGLYNLGKLKRY
jgi:SET domain-containing protein